MQVSPDENLFFFVDIAEISVLNYSLCAILRQKLSSPDQRVLAKQEIEIERNEQRKAQ